MPQLKVAGLIIQIDCTDEELPNYFDDYRITLIEKYDMKISTEKCDYIEHPTGNYIAEGEINWIKKNAEMAGYFLLGVESLQRVLFALLDIDSSFKNGYLYYLGTEKEGYDSYRITFYFYNLTGIMFRYNLLAHEGIVIHAASIVWNDKGIIFTAPSGTGKSTHVMLWQKCFGSEVVVINEDTPALRFKDGQPLIFGTPWSGNGVNNNISAPLDTIVILEQASQNTIRKLDMQEALRHLIPRCFLPYFDKNLMNMAMTVIERIALSVPIYLLQCRPDKQAVEVVYQYVR